MTGAAGLIGTVLREHLGTSYELHGADRRSRARGGLRPFDQRRRRSARRTVVGHTVVIDLAASLADRWWSVERNNIPATFSLLAAAAETGVERVILASSNHVVGGYEADEPYASVVTGRYGGIDPSSIPVLTSTAALRPDGPYGIGKAAGEAAGRYFSDRHGLSVICLRIGTVNALDRPLEPRHFATFMSHRDLAELVRCCIEAPPSVRFAVLYGVSANRWRFWDLDEAREKVGFVPLDDAESWRDVQIPRRTGDGEGTRDGRRAPRRV